MDNLLIQEAGDGDWQDIWQLLQEVFAEGTTYPYPAETSETEAREIWFAGKEAVFVARDRDSGEFLGTYYIRKNQPGRGDHVSNCGYITSPAARGRGVASLMCEHSQDIAQKLGFAAMQFNFVVSTNEGAVRLWQKLGFDIVGTLPGAFRHPELGYVDALVMFKRLEAAKRLG